MPLYDAIAVLEVLEALEGAGRLEGRRYLSGTGLNALAEAWLDVTLPTEPLRAVLIASNLELNVKANGYPVEALRAQTAPGSPLRQIAERAKAGAGYEQWENDREKAREAESGEA